MDQSESSFGKVSTGWFLTWPHCPVSKEDALRSLQTTSVSRIVEYVVCREKHEHGEPHLHAFLKYEGKVHFSPNRWDLFEDGIRYHGNYQVARSWEKCKAYCQKDGDFIASFCTDKALKKHAARNQQFIEHADDLKDLVLNGTIGLAQLPAIQKGLNSFFNMQKPYQSETVKGVWIHGPPGVGKTHFARTNYQNLYYKAQNKWFDLYQPKLDQRVNILFDDLDHGAYCLGHYIKLWADKWGCYGEIKGGYVALQHEYFIVTSNYTIEQIWGQEGQDQEMYKAIRRRFKVFHLLDRSLGLQSKDAKPEVQLTKRMPDQDFSMMKPKKTFPFKAKSIR